ncbi:MAG: carbohydrate-binding protein, partial [Deltaproteobacteria bacterium]|nr:carbohydrate-binding protein [Deltaproteobacteria bacterium]
NGNIIDSSGYIIDSSGNIVDTSGNILDTAGNIIVPADSDHPVDTVPVDNTPDNLIIQAECAFGANTGDCGGSYGGTQSGTTLENSDTTVGYIENQDYLSYSKVDLTGFDKITFKYAKDLAGGTVEIHLGSVSGTKIGTFVPSLTGGWTTFSTGSVNISGTSGVYDIYLVALYSADSTQGVLNIDYIELSADGGGTTTDTGGSTDTDQTSYPPITNGLNAGTTRYWDCCKPHCGWHSNMQLCDINDNDLFNAINTPSGCDGGSAFQCWDYSPIEVNSKLSYGWVAFNNDGTNCGDCFQLDFKGDLAGKQMVVQVVNIGDGGYDSFDILIPGGGVGAMNGCSTQWGSNVNLGETYGGFYATCNGDAGCIKNMCQSAFGSKTLLMNGCNWFLGWFQNSNNPSVVYKKLSSCPKAITNISRI